MWKLKMNTRKQPSAFLIMKLRSMQRIRMDSLLYPLLLETVISLLSNYLSFVELISVLLLVKKVAVVDQPVNG